MSDVTTNPDETVVQPPDDLVAKEVSAIVNYDSNKDKASRAKPSNSATPSTSTSNTSRVRIQETRNKRFTPAQQQRQEIYKSMVALFEAENKKEDKEDEIDMAFTACAVRMRIHLNKDQIEDVIQEVEGVVRRAINNVRKGMPALTPSPVPFMQPGANVIQSQMSGLVPMQQPQQQQCIGSNFGAFKFFNFWWENYSAYYLCATWPTGKNKLLNLFQN